MPYLRDNLWRMTGVLMLKTPRRRALHSGREFAPGRPTSTANFTKNATFAIQGGTLPISRDRAVGGLGTGQRTGGLARQFDCWKEITRVRQTCVP